MPDLSRLNGIIAGASMPLTTSTGTPMKRGVTIKFRGIIRAVIESAPAIMAIVASGKTFFFGNTRKTNPMTMEATPVAAICMINPANPLIPLLISS